MPTRIKICGVTRIEDAELVADAGVDAMGMIFYEKSPSYISIDQAKILCEAVQPLVTTVAVVVNPDQSTLTRIANDTGVDRFQFHGNESSAECNLSPRPWYKALRVKDKSDLIAQLDVHSQAAGFLLDAYVKGVPGGTGEVFNWSLINEVEIKKPVLLAGGLTPDNVYEAIITARPYAVDLKSGVEIKPGIKDAVMVNEFIIAVREADESIKRSS